MIGAAPCASSVAGRAGFSSRRCSLLRDGGKLPWRPARICRCHNVNIEFHDDRNGGRELVWQYQMSSNFFCARPTQRSCGVGGSKGLFSQKDRVMDELQPRGSLNKTKILYGLR